MVVPSQHDLYQAWHDGLHESKDSVRTGWSPAKVENVQAEHGHVVHRRWLCWRSSDAASNSYPTQVPFINLDMFCDMYFLGCLCVELPSGDQSFWNQCLWAISSQVWFRSGLACWACVWHCRPLKEDARNEIEQMFLVIFFTKKWSTWIWQHDFG